MSFQLSCDDNRRWELMYKSLFSDLTEAEQKELFELEQKVTFSNWNRIPDKRIDVELLQEVL